MVVEREITLHASRKYVFRAGIRVRDDLTLVHVGHGYVEES